jgi:hypothetical protein
LLDGIFDAEVGIGDIEARRVVFDNDPRVGGGGPSPEDFECSASSVGGDALVTFAGDRGSREFLRSIESGWVATVTGQVSETVSGGAGESYFVRLKGNGYSDNPAGFTDVACT